MDRFKLSKLFFEFSIEVFDFDPNFRGSFYIFPNIKYAFKASKRQVTWGPCISIWMNRDKLKDKMSKRS